MNHVISVDTILGKQSTLELRLIHVGGIYHVEEEVQISSSIPSFVGAMQQFMFNGQHYFEIARSTGGTPAQKGIDIFCMKKNTSFSYVFQTFTFVALDL